MDGTQKCGVTVSSENSVQTGMCVCVCVGGGWRLGGPCVCVCVNEVYFDTSAAQMHTLVIWHEFLCHATLVTLSPFFSLTYTHTPRHTHQDTQIGSPKWSRNNDIISSCATEQASSQGDQGQQERKWERGRERECVCWGMRGLVEKQGGSKHSKRICKCVQVRTGERGSCSSLC